MKLRSEKTANYIIDSSLGIQGYCDTLIKNEKVRNRENSKMINQEQKQLIKSIELKLKAMKKQLD